MSRPNAVLFRIILILVILVAIVRTLNYEGNVKIKLNFSPPQKQVAEESSKQLKVQKHFRESNQNNMSLALVIKWRPNPPKTYLIECCGRNNSCINLRPKKKSPTRSTYQQNTVKRVSQIRNKYFFILCFLIEIARI
jgi:hypothetical protein